MMVASQGSAAAQCASQNTAPVTNSTPSNCITIYTPGAYTGDLTNNSTLTPTGSYSPGIPGTATGISVLKTGVTLNGNIINSGTIDANTIPGKQIGINIGEGATNSVNQNAGAILNGSITNSGTINSQVGIWVSGNSSPLLSTATGSISNAAGGLINYTNNGISVNWATVGGSITNAGTITGTGTGGINVAFANVGSTGVSGSGNIVNATGAKIASTYIGIVLNGNSKSAAAGATIAGSIINEGTITVPNLITHAGIQVAAATALGGVTNTGTINGGVGIMLFGAIDAGGPARIASVAGSIVNQGQINAVATNGSAGGIQIFGFTGGAPATVGGSIVNSGTIDVTGTGGTNAGILLAGARLAGSITNSNTISVSGGAINAGIAVVKSSNANFSSAYSSIGGGIINIGNITAVTGILVSGGSTIGGGITTSGTINASIDAINLTGEGGPTTITVLGGAITGNIVGGGSDTVNFTLGAGSFSYSNTISAVTAVNVNSGTLFDGGAISAGSVNVNAGGVLAPGLPHTVGTLNITGNLVFASAAAYLETISGASSSKTAVTGTATLGGASVRIASGSTVTVGTKYTILTDTGGGLGGANIFAGAVSYNGDTGTLSYDANDVYLTFGAAQANLVGLLPPGAPQNVVNVANAIDNFVNGGGTLPPQFSNLFNLSGPALVTSLTQLDGEAATGAQTSAFQLMTQLFDLLFDQSSGGGGGGGLGFAGDETAGLPPEIALAYDSILKAPPKPNFDQRWTSWGAAFGGSSITNGNTTVGSNTVTAGTYGFAGGMDYHVDPATTYGFALSGGGTNWNLAQGLGGGRSDAVQAALYAKHYVGPAYLFGALAFGNNWFTTNRTAMGDQLTASFAGQSYAARLEGGYRFALPVFAEGVIAGVTPYGALQTQWFHAPAYSETDLTGGGLGLAFNSVTANDTRSELGARVDDLTMFYGMPLIWRGRLAWAHDWVSNIALNAAFQSLPGSSFIVNGAAPPTDSALASAGAELHINAHWTALAKFEGEFAPTSQTYAGSGTLKYTW